MKGLRGEGSKNHARHGRPQNQATHGRKRGSHTSRDVAELLGVSSCSALNVLAYMEAIGIVDHVRRFRNHYFLRGAYDEGEPPAKHPPEALILPVERAETRNDSKYDQILDKFMVCEHRLVEVTVKGKKANYVRHLLDKRIKARGLEGRVEAYVSDKTLYLEKV